MANYDNLTVKCDDAKVINRLTAEDTRICGLWFYEKRKSEDKPNECYLTVRNGVKWLEALEKMSNDYNEAITVEVAFESDNYKMHYNLLIKNGTYELFGVRAGEEWWDIKEGSLTSDQIAEIDTACDQYFL